MLTLNVIINKLKSISKTQMENLKEKLLEMCISKETCLEHVEKLAMMETLGLDFRNAILFWELFILLGVMIKKELPSQVKIVTIPFSILNTGINKRPFLKMMQICVKKVLELEKNSDLFPFVPLILPINAMIWDMFHVSE